MDTYFRIFFFKGLSGGPMVKTALLLPQVWVQLLVEETKVPHATGHSFPPPPTPPPHPWQKKKKKNLPSLRS